MFGGQEAELKSTVALGSCSADGRGQLITSPFRPGPELGLLGVGWWGEAPAAGARRCIIHTSPSQDWLLS